MKIIRLSAAVKVSPEEQKYRTIDQLLRGIGRGFYQSQTGRVTDNYSEFETETAYGTAYIQVHFDQKTEMIRVERYFESEFVQDEYGTAKLIPINYANPQITATAIQSTIKALQTS